MTASPRSVSWADLAPAPHLPELGKSRAHLRRNTLGRRQFNAEFDAHHTYIPRFCQMYAATGADLSMPALHCRSTGFGSRS